ncbi:MarR family winged helix-turn-helix transcriptional regulator [Longispora albida]|uniref:MarR family winged helix-turn-helix transcriptional regulator n=1 Tax=Longispora albida TaxID=203523 RepID=UPI000378DA47|nr:MarR family transcriptional regulator [Longispora albida]
MENEAPRNTMALSSQLCFALYSASRAMTAVYRPMLAELGLTYPQYLVMLALWERDGRTVSDLGSDLQLDSGTLSPLLKRLEALGFVTRQRSSADERRVEIALTDDGRALRGRAEGIPARLACEIDLPGTDFAALHRTLTEITTTIHRRHSS